jgi:hypothetical protein
MNGWWQWLSDYDTGLKVHSEPGDARISAKKKNGPLGPSFDSQVEARGLEPLTSSMPWMRSTKTELCPH